MNWTRNKPTEAGWYWWRPDYDATPSPVLVRQTQDKCLYVIQFGGKEIFMQNMGGEWIGPLSPTDRQQGRVEGLDEVERYMAMRLRLAEASLATEILAGNEVKQGRERAAIAELHGMQRHVSDIKENLAQQAQEGGQ